MTEKTEPYIQTYSGLRFYFNDFSREDFQIEDIAHALSQEARFGGHTREEWTVCHHSLLVAQLMPPGLEIWGLLHDAHEAYIKDIPTPLKKIIGPAYEIIAGRIQDEIWRWTGLRAEDLPGAALKKADRLALAAECRDFMLNYDLGLRDLPEVAAREIPRIISIPRKQAKTDFIERWLELTGEMLDRRNYEQP